MPTLREMIASPAWWITVVLGTIVLNIISTYLYRQTESRIARFSAATRRRVRDRDRRIQYLVHHVTNEPGGLAEVRYIVLRRLAREVYYMLVAGSFGTFGIIAYLLCSYLDEAGSPLVPVLQGLSVIMLVLTSIQSVIMVAHLNRTLEFEIALGKMDTLEEKQSKFVRRVDQESGPDELTPG